MPNWTSNSLTIKGDPSSLGHLRDFVKGETAFDFNRILPMPSELEGIIVGSNTIDGKRVHQWRTVNGKAVAISDEELADLKMRFGVADWYEWSIHNWGTKWNACDVETEHTEDYLNYTFDTAWSTPTPVIEKLVSKYPELTFIHSYSYEDEDGGWEVEYVNGQRWQESAF